MSNTRLEGYLEFIGVNTNTEAVSQVITQMYSLFEDFIPTETQQNIKNLAVVGVGLIGVLDILENVSLEDGIDWGEFETLTEFAAVLISNDMLTEFLIELNQIHAMGIDLMEVYDSFEALDGLEVATEAASLGVDILEGAATFGLSILASYATKKAGDKINEELQRRLGSLRERTRSRVEVLQLLSNISNPLERANRVMPIILDMSRIELFGR